MINIIVSLRNLTGGSATELPLKFHRDHAILTFDHGFYNEASRSCNKKPILLIWINFNPSMDT